MTPKDRLVLKVLASVAVAVAGAVYVDWLVARSSPLAVAVWFAGYFGYQLVKAALADYRYERTRPRAPDLDPRREY